MAVTQATAWRSSGTMPTPAAVTAAAPACGEIGAADIEAALGRPQQAGQHHAELALAVALDAGQADDLAAADVEGEVVEPRDAVAVAAR